MDEENNLIRCPNFCCDGIILIRDKEKALYDTKQCPYCKGIGKVTKKQAIKIEKQL